MRRFAHLPSSMATGLSLAALCGGGRRSLSYHNDYFALLGVGRDVKVDLDALRKNYHAFQSQHHPDLHPSSTSVASAEAGPSPTEPAAAAGKVMNLKDATAYAANAYAVLKDPFLRCRYLRLLLEADAKAVAARDKALLPTGEAYYSLAVSHDASEAAARSNNNGEEGGAAGTAVDDSAAVSEAVRAEDKAANPVNTDQEFLMEMMELNMRLAEALEHDEGAPERKAELDSLRAVVADLEEGYAASCESLYGRIVALREKLLGGDAAAADGSAGDVFKMAKDQFRDTVLKWTFASNLRRQINEAY